MSESRLQLRGIESRERARRFVFALVVIFASFTIAPPSQCAQQSSGTPSASNNKSLDNAMKAMFDVHTFQQTEISPDGKRVAWVESLPGPGGEPSANSAIYVAEVSTPEATTRTTAGDGKTSYEEHDVAWSPDGKSCVSVRRRDARPAPAFRQEFLRRQHETVDTLERLPRESRMVAG
jgi:hypothetical protein